MTLTAASARPVSLLRALVPPTIALALLLIATLTVQPWLESLWGFEHPRWVERLHRGILAAYAAVGVWFAFALVWIVGLEWILSRATKKAVPRIIKDFCGVIFFFVAVAICIAILFDGVFGSLLTLSSIFGIVIGLALRPIILDVFSGLSSNLESAYQIGDWITLESAKGNHTGWVMEVNWRTTLLRTRAGTIVVCPNSLFSTSVVLNHTRPHIESRIDFRLRLPPEVPCERAIELIMRGVMAETTHPEGPRVHPAPEVLVSDLSHTGVEYWVRFWMDNTAYSQNTVMSRVQQSVMRHLRMAGIRLSSGRQEIYLGRLQNGSAHLDDVADRIAVLEGVALFLGLGRDSLRTLASNVQLRRFGAGEVLVKEHAHTTEMYVVLEGHLQAYTDKGGRRIQFGRLLPGDFFGEMAMLTGDPRSASVATTTPVVLFEIERGTIMKLVEEEPALLETLSRNLANRRRQQEQAIESAEADRLGSAEPLQLTLLRRMQLIFRSSRIPWNSR
ncbi:MAG: mechanosensitive ion channel family protein [Verrucomicrobiota bacterium JB022]|nr:mechanosensitive ion channel family protein [Verrucomicrobiota bacterium JB022]